MITVSRNVMPTSKNWANIFQTLIGNNLSDLYERAQVDPQAALDDFPNVLKALDYGLKHEPDWSISRDLILCLSPLVPRREVGQEWEDVLRRSIVHSNTKNDAAQIELRLHLSTHLRLQAKLSEAQGCLEKAIALCDTLKDRTHYWMLQVQLALVSCRQADYDKAQMLAEKVLLKADIDDRVRAESINVKGLVLYERRQCEEALQTFEAALMIYDDLGDQYKKAHLLVNCGIALRQLGHYAKAERRYEEAIRHFKSVNDQIELYKAVMNVGNLHLVKQEHEMAIKHYLEASAIFKTHNLFIDLANVSNNLGLAYTDLKQWESAELFFGQALEVWESLGNNFKLANVLNNLGDMFIQMNNRGKSLSVLKEALATIVLVPSSPAEQRLHKEIVASLKKARGD